jgi:Protein of unknown function (DUF2752)
MKKTFINIIKHLNKNLEALMWIFALVYLILINPYQIQHFSFCLFKLIGIDFCPGCGIGRSISLIYHGDFLASLRMHPLGLFALLVIIYRIITLLRKNKFKIIRG